MEGFLIAGFVMGAACLIASFVIKEKKGLSKEDREKLIEEIRTIVLSDKNMEPILAQSKEKVRENLEGLVSELLLKAEDKIGENTSAKMLALNEMYEDLAAKIEHSHKEVVFLYDMLNQKEDDLKKFSSQIEGIRKGMAEEEKKLVLMYQYINKKMKEVTEKEQEVTKAKTEEKPVKELPPKKKEKAQKQEVKQEELKEENPVDQQKRIVELHKKGKNITEISRELEMGQGEVRLILGLYGKND